MTRARGTLLAVGLTLFLAAGANAADWVSTGGAPEGGTVNRLVVDSGGRLWAGTQTAGLFRSDEDDATWHRVLGGSGIGALAVDPANRDLLLASNRSGVLRSVDAGATWTTVLSTPAGVLAFAPSDPRRVYLSDGKAVWRSVDRGVHWQKLTVPEPSGLIDLAVDPRSPRIVHAASWNGIYRSADSGQTWTQARGISGVIGRVQTDPHHPARVYASGELGDVWRSDNQGRTWRQIADLDGQPIPAFRVDPTTPDTLYAATTDYLAPAYERFTLRRSTDGGATWVPVFSTSEAINDIALRPVAVYLGIDALGVVRGAIGGTSWREVNDGLTAAQVTRIVPAPQGGALYAAVRTFHDGFRARGLGVWKSDDGGANWEPVNAGLGAALVANLTADHRRPGTLYAATNVGLFKTDDGGTGWRRLESLPLTTVRDVALDLFDSQVVYAVGDWKVDGATFSAAFRSLDGGATWKQIHTGIFTGILIDLWNPGTVYLGGPGAIFRTADRGTTWESVGSGWAAGRERMVSGPSPGRLAGIAPTPIGPPGFDPTAPRPTLNYLFDSFDAGAHWRNVALPGGPASSNQVMDLARSAVPASPVYAASLYGVARMLPGARQWRAVGTRRFEALSVAVDPRDPGRLYAGTADGQVLVLDPSGGQ